MAVNWLEDECIRLFAHVFHLIFYVNLNNDVVSFVVVEKHHHDLFFFQKSFDHFLFYISFIRHFYS